MSQPTVAVIGAGWAGCAAAVELAQAGAQVTLYEAARIAGGRARRIDYQHHALDNGQHILLGAYRDTLRLMRVVGLQPSQLLLRLPLQMRYPSSSDGMDLLAARLPAPLHLLIGVLSAKGLSIADKLAIARFASAARWMGWQLNVDYTVSELLDRFDQTDRLTKLMWRPLCIAALNTPPERASAKVFLAVLRDSLGAGRSASDMLLPRVDLSTLFPDAALNAAHWLHQALYRDGLDLNESDTYRRMAIAFDIEPEAFITLMMSDAMSDALDDEFAYVSSLGIEGFPTLLLEHNDNVHVLSYGFTPFEELDMMLQTVFGRREA
jgi:hypothetical protein